MRSYLAAGALLVLIHLPLQTANPDFHNADAWYHVQLTRLWGVEPLGPGFRWTRESVWYESYSDKEVLFHAYLWPFVHGGEAMGWGVVWPSKLAMLLLAVAQGLVWLLLLRRAGVPGALWWVLAIAGCGAPWLFRDAMLRPHVLAVLLLSAFVMTYARREWRAVAAIAFAFPLAYTAFHAVPMAAVLISGAWFVLRRDASWKGVAIVGAAVALGALLHPDMPRHLGNWYVQNVELPRAAKLATPALRRDLAAELTGLEWIVLRYMLPVVALWVGIGLAAWRVRPEDDTLAVTLVALGFAVLPVKAMRFLEHWVPLTVLAAALWWRDLGWRPARRWPAVLGLAALLVVAIVPAAMALRQKRYPDYRPAAEYLAARATPGEPVFHPSFSDFPMLWFHNPRNDYLVALDPVYFFARDAERFERWSAIAHGEHGAPAKAIREVFGCRWVVVVDNRRHAALIEQLESTAWEVVLPRRTRVRVFEVGE